MMRGNSRKTARTCITLHLICTPFLCYRYNQRKRKRDALSTYISGVLFLWGARAIPPGCARAFSHADKACEVGQGELDYEEMSVHVSRGDDVPDWERIRAEYIAGGISIRQLAEKYGLNRGAVGRRAKAEDWSSERAKTVTKVRQKTDDTIVTQQAQANAENADIAARIRMKLLQRLEQEIDALPESIGTRLSRDGKECKLRDLTGAYLDLTREAPDAANAGDFTALDEVDYGKQ